ncbi:unnamed protein product [Caenorhabditis brenneri]
MTDFYITLVSNAQATSSISNFNTHLPNTIVMDREYEVGLVSIIYPTSHDLISAMPEENGWNENEFVVWYNDKPLKCSVANCTFSNPMELVEILNHTISQRMDKAKNTTNSKIQMFEYQGLFKRIMIKNIENVSRVHFSARLAYFIGHDRFIKTFPTLGKYSTYSGSDLMYVYSENLVEPQTISHMKVPLLKVINMNTGNGTNTEQTFTKPLYVRVRPSEVSKIGIQIKNDRDHFIPFNSGKIVIVLHFRPTSHLTMLVYFDPDTSIDWVSFFEPDQTQAGSNGFRAGSLYQRGNGPFSQLLGKLFISAVPLLKRMGVSMGREVLDSSLRVANDVVAGDSFKQSLSKNASNSYNTLVTRAIDKLGQKGGRRKRRSTKPRADVPIKVSLANFIGASFFNQVKLSFNNVLVYDSTHYAYKAYIQTLLGENDETKKGFLSAAGWKDCTDLSKSDLPLDMDGHTDGIDICTPLFLEPFQTEKLLIPHINIQLELYRNTDQFCLECADNDFNGRLVISDLKLHMRAIDVVPSATIALENRLRTTPAQYPFTITKAKVITIPEGRVEVPFNMIYSDILPRRLIIGLIAPDAMEGKFTKNCFNFEHNHLSEIQIDAGGTMYPPQPIRCDFTNNNYALAFTRMYEELGCVSNKTCPRITYEMFRSGFAFYVFNLSPLDTSSSWELLKSGSTQLFMKFNTKTPTGGLNALILSQYDGMSTIDSFRNVTVTHHR